MIYEPSTLAVIVFGAFVAFTLGISFYLGSKAKSASGYFAAHGEIHWFVNGIAFAGDYLSAASFLGICGMIAFYGYDGFLYSIGFLAGWIVALFVIAEPMKRLGKFTFADALDAKFQSKGIKLAAGISTLIVSIFYLIPQMVGAGALVTPLLGFEHWQGVLLVGITVVLLVVTAGMVSTTYVQFLKGALLVVFSTILTVMILNRGFEVAAGGADGHEFESTPSFPEASFESSLQQFAAQTNRTIIPNEGIWQGDDIVLMRDADGQQIAFTKYIDDADGGMVSLREAQTKVVSPDDTVEINGQVQEAKEKGEPDFHPVGHVSKLPDDKTSTGPLGPVEFFRELRGSEIVLWGNRKLKAEDGTTATYQISLNSEPTSPVTVTISSDSQSNTDLTMVSFTPLTWADVQTVTITAVLLTQIPTTTYQHTATINATNDSNSGWMLMTHAETPLACAARRCDWTDNYAEYMRRGYLWGAKGHPLNQAVPDLLCLDKVSQISGKDI